jgi:NDP-sugar pyrophosphorylase family protein
MLQTPQVIVPAAGFGQRFRSAGYKEDKPLIKVGGKTLIEWSLSCLPAEWQSAVTAVIRDDQQDLDFALRATRMRPTRVVHLLSPSQGAACSVLAAAVGLPSDDPVLVMNTDQWFKCDLRAAHEWAMKEHLDGFVLTFPGTGPAWSYAVTNGADRITHVIEKKQVSPHATVGVYWWRKASDLVHSICSMIAAGTKTKGEFYLAPSLEFLPLSEKDVRIVPVDEFHGLGTPEHLKEFRARLAEGWTP